jgi:hypothetical protein
VAGDAASAGPVGRPLGVGSVWPARATATSALGARRSTLPALLGGDLAPAQGVGGRRRRRRWCAYGAAGCEGQGGAGVQFGCFCSRFSDGRRRSCVAVVARLPLRVPSCGHAGQGSTDDVAAVRSWWCYSRSPLSGTVAWLLSLSIILVLGYILCVRCSYIDPVVVLHLPSCICSNSVYLNIKRAKHLEKNKLIFFL